MRRPPCPGDNHAQAALVSGARILRQIVRSAMRRDHLHIMSNPEFTARISGPLHRRPIRVAAHDDANDWFRRNSRFHFPFLIQFTFRDFSTASLRARTRGT